MSVDEQPRPDRASHAVLGSTTTSRGYGDHVLVWHGRYPIRIREICYGSLAMRRIPLLMPALLVACGSTPRPRHRLRLHQPSVRPRASKRLRRHTTPTSCPSAAFFAGRSTERRCRRAAARPRDVGSARWIRADRWRPAIESYVPTVKPVNQRPARGSPGWTSRATSTACTIACIRSSIASSLCSASLAPGIPSTTRLSARPSRSSSARTEGSSRWVS